MKADLEKQGVPRKDYEDQLKLSHPPSLVITGKTDPAFEACLHLLNSHGLYTDPSAQRQVFFSVALHGNKAYEHDVSCGLQ